MKYSEMKTIKAKEDFIREKLVSDTNWTIRGLIAIWNKQTADEKATKDTRHHNGVGFTGSDAEFFTKMAERAAGNMGLSYKQLACVQRGMKKYAGQLRKIADGVI